MRRTFQVLLAAAALATCATSYATAAAQLVMIDLRSCTYCAKFKREVAPNYNETKVGKVAPLRFVNPLKRWPEDLADVKPAPYTPVFILVEDGREIGRFAGYSSPDKFWNKLEPLLGRL